MRVISLYYFISGAFLLYKLFSHVRIVFCLSGHIEKSAHKGAIEFI